MVRPGVPVKTPELHANPFAQVIIDHNPGGGIREVLVKSPVRGQYLRKTKKRGKGAEGLALAILRQLHDRSPIKKTGDQKTNALLRKMGLLIPRNELPRRPRFGGKTNDPWKLLTGRFNPWGRETRQKEIAKRTFRETGACSFSPFMSNQVTKLLSSYYRRRLQQGFLSLGDARTSLRYWEHNESVARFLQEQLTPFVSRLAGKKLKPTYTYLGIYLEGGRLRKHTDRKQCEITLSVMLDHLKKGKGRPAPWPLYYEDKSGRTHSVTMAPGDAFIFKGRELPHYRLPLPRNETYTVLMIHYVDARFEGSLK